MREEYKEVELETLNKGDVVHVSFKSEYSSSVYLNKTVDYLSVESLFAVEGEVFHIPYSRFYLVKKAKKSLPTAIGSAVKHPDGWKFIRIGQDNWKGIDPEGEVSATRWYDTEISCDEWKEL